MGTNLELISKIADRAVEMAVEDRIPFVDKLTVMMDLEATIADDTPLDLDGLLNANDSDFAHDIYGIRANLNRNTGKLENCFLPRYARRG